MTRSTDGTIEEFIAIDKHGVPTTYLCFNILKTMLREHNIYFSMQDLCALHAARKKDVELICRSLHDVDFISRNPINSNEIKYNIHCDQENLQCAFERYLVEVREDSIPVHRHLPYGPHSRETDSF